MADLAEYNAFMAKIRPLLQAATLVDLDDDVMRLRNALQHLSKVYASYDFDSMSFPVNLLYGDDIIVTDSKGRRELKNTIWSEKPGKRRVSLVRFIDEDSSFNVSEESHGHLTYSVCVPTCAVGFDGEFFRICSLGADLVQFRFWRKHGMLYNMEGTPWCARTNWMEINACGQPRRAVFSRSLGYYKDGVYVLHLGSQVHTLPPELLNCYVKSDRIHESDVLAGLVFGKWTRFVEMSKAERIANERELLAPDAKKTKKKKPKRKPRCTPTDSVALGDTCAQGAELVCPSPPPAETVTPPAPVPPPGVALHDDDAYCVVCLDEARECAIVPCGHRCLCAGCAARFGAGAACPVCRGDVGAVMRIYG